MSEVLSLFITIGGIIFLGYLGSLFFDKTKIPDLLILIAAGILLGPVLGVADTAFFASLTPFFAALALVVLLFDGGLNLNFARVVNELGRAFVFTIACFVLSTLLVAGVMVLVFGWPLLFGLLLGAVVGGTSSAVVIPLVGKISGNEQTKTVLKLESALTDALCVITAIAVIEIILARVTTIGEIGNSLIGAFSIAAVVGIIASIIWLAVLQRLKGVEFDYLLTLGTVFLLYAVVEGVKGNGAIAVLVFGIALGNAERIAIALNQDPEKYVLEEDIRKFQTEVSFFVRTFFFVYLGLLFDLYHVSPGAVAVAVVILIAILASRGAITRLLIPGGNAGDRMLSFIMIPRGLAAAVLASLPFTMGITLDAYPFLIVFAQAVFLVILFTNVITTVGVFKYEQQYGRAYLPQAAAAQARQAGQPKVISTKNAQKR
ncbi:hypothetical protein AUJ14_06230 [Candidatus Micrarchaeota archaeon CG1_02_55_22]|nr:MAG: hypothetical protein AUJ14_06230 [Candidatus Micrarchaeota archaeon CG1_02_55_22]